jgi:hypothetical protein
MAAVTGKQVWVVPLRSGTGAQSLFMVPGICHLLDDKSRANPAIFKGRTTDYAAGPLSSNR